MWARPVDARPDAVVAVPRHHHPCARPGRRSALQVTGNVPVEHWPRCTRRRSGAGRITGLVLPAVPDDAVDKRRIGGIATVMARVDANGPARRARWRLSPGRPGPLAGERPWWRSAPGGSPRAELSAWPVLHPASAAPIPVTISRRADEATPASQLPVPTSHRLFPSGRRQEPPGRRAANSLAQPSRDAMPPYPGREPCRLRNVSATFARFKHGPRLRHAPCPVRGRTRTPLPRQASAGDPGWPGLGGRRSAISVTRSGDEAYDLRDIPVRAGPV